jgi:HK97 family phage prohead protease
MIYKAFSNCKIDDLDNKGRVVVAANAFDNEDSDGDISAVGSFSKTLKEHFNRARWFKDHDKTILIGVPIEGVEVYPHLKMVGQLNMEKQVSRDVYSDYKLYAEYGKSLEHSVGVNPIQRDQKDKRIVKEWRLWEYSTLSSWGANENTPMLGIKSAKDFADSIDWLDIMLRKGDYTDERFKQIELQIKTLRSLAKEPEPTDATTQKDEPNEKGSEAIATLKNFNQSLIIKNSLHKWKI